jgi:hypothetical protein
LPARLPAFAEHGLVRAARGLTVITLPLPAPGAAALLAAFAELGIPTEDAAGEVAARERFRDDLEQLLRAARGTYALHREWHGPLIGGGVAAVVALLVAYVGPRPSPGVSLILGLLAAICWLVALLSFLSLPQRLIVGPTGLRLEGHLPRSRVIAADDILGFETASIRNGEILLIAVAGGNDQVRLTPALRAAFARAGPDVLGRLGLPAGWVNLRVAGTGRC